MPARPATEDLLRLEPAAPRFVELTAAPYLALRFALLGAALLLWLLPTL